MTRSQSNSSCRRLSPFGTAALLIFAAAGLCCGAGVLFFGLAAYRGAGKAPEAAVNWRVRLVEDSRDGIVHVVMKNQAGTGFVIARDGENALVLTNRHVVANAFSGKVSEAASIRLPDRTRLPMARLVALPRDEAIDLALLLVRDSRNRLKPLTLGGYTKDPIGEEVAAIGHPFDLDYTITDGIISARRDDLMIQHSAQINPGNSGGPLFNSSFEVIGVNTSFMSGDGTSPLNGGLNFATRSDYVITGDWDYPEEIYGLLESIRVAGGEPVSWTRPEPVPAAEEEGSAENPAQFPEADTEPADVPDASEEA